MVNRTTDSALEVTLATPQTITKQDALLYNSLVRFCLRNKIEIKRVMLITQSELFDESQLETQTKG